MIYPCSWVGWNDHFGGLEHWKSRNGFGIIGKIYGGSTCGSMCYRYRTCCDHNVVWSWLYYSTGFTQDWYGVNSRTSSPQFSYVLIWYMYHVLSKSSIWNSQTHRFTWLINFTVFTPFRTDKQAFSIPNVKSKAGKSSDPFQWAELISYSSGCVTPHSSFSQNSNLLLPKHTPTRHHVGEMEKRRT